MATTANPHAKVNFIKEVALVEDEMWGHGNYTRIWGCTDVGASSILAVLTQAMSMNKVSNYTGQYSH
jgi:GTP-binding protein EngB required for normal cell division